MSICLCKEMECLISFAKQNSVILIKSENVQVASGMLQRHGLIQLTSLKTRFSYQLIGLQRCGNDGVVQPTTTMEMGVQVIDVGLLRAYAEVIITGDDSRRPTNRTPLDRHGGGGHVARVALLALYPGRRRPQGLRLHVFHGRLRAGGLSRCVALYPGHRGQ